MSYELEIGNKKEDALVVSLEMAKSNSRIMYADEDEFLQLILDASVEEIENYVGYPVLVRENSKIKLNYFRDLNKLPFVIASIQAVTFKDAGGVEQNLDVQEVDFNLLSPNRIRFINTPEEATDIVITVELGYEVANMPDALKRAVLLQFGFAEAYRESMPEKASTSAMAVARPYKMY